MRERAAGVDERSDGVTRTPMGLVYEVSRILEAHKGAYFFPAHIARELNVSWMEVALALQVLVEMQRAFKRDDGRFLWMEGPKPGGATA